MIKRTTLTIALAAAALTGCANLDERGNAALGGAVGGATGAVIGHEAGGREGAVIGAGVGGATGAAIGQKKTVGAQPTAYEERRERRRRHRHDHNHDHDD